VLRDWPDARESRFPVDPGIVKLRRKRASAFLVDEHPWRLYSVGPAGARGR